MLDPGHSFEHRRAARARRQRVYRRRKRAGLITLTIELDFFSIAASGAVSWTSAVTW
jgi:hypothetical protein